MPSKLTDQQYKEFLREKFPTLQSLEPYTGSLSKLDHRCKLHGNTFRTSYNNLKIQASKKGGSLCPQCAAERTPAPAKNGYVTTLVSQEEAQHRLDAKFGVDRVRIVGRYAGVSKEVELLCTCGRRQLNSISKLLALTYPCDCTRTPAMIPFKQLQKKENEFIEFLYTKMFFTASQIADLTGVKVATVITSLKAGGTYRPRNTSQALRRRRRDSHSGQSDFLSYQRQARLLTTYIYNTYSAQLDPKRIRDTDYHLDHMFSIHDGYRAYEKPVPLSLLCHPANLKIVSASANLKKNKRSKFKIQQLRKFVAEFESKHGVVEFPEALRLEFDREQRVHDGGLRVLACDPGTSNFGVFGGVLFGSDSLLGCKALVSKMVENTIRKLDDSFHEQVVAFVSEMRELIERVRPHVVVIERFQTRGLKGTTIELINVMLGALAGLLKSIEDETGVQILLKIVTASQWKNALNKAFRIEALYEHFPASQLHRLDACLMAFYAFPDKRVYHSLDAKKLSAIVNFIQRTRR